LGSASQLFTVVIASLCDDVRAGLLKRACDSVRAMAADHDYSIVVVANGPRVSPRVLAWLATRPDVRIIQLRSGSHPLARRVGAEMADGEFLAFLDDDDEFMPGTLPDKVAFFRQHPDIDVLVTDGLRVNDGVATKIFPPPEIRSTDLVETMMRAGWGACALTLRARKVDLSALDAEFRHLEWTLTALELARHHKIGFLDQPTYRYYEDTPASLSKCASTTWLRRRSGADCHAAMPGPATTRPCGGATEPSVTTSRGNTRVAERWATPGGCTPNLCGHPAALHSCRSR